MPHIAESTGAEKGRSESSCRDDVGGNTAHSPCHKREWARSRSGRCCAVEDGGGEETGNRRHWPDA